MKLIQCLIVIIFGILTAWAMAAVITLSKSVGWTMPLGAVCVIWGAIMGYMIRGEKS